MTDRPTDWIDFEALYDPSAGADAAVIDAVASYPAIAAHPPAPETLLWLRGTAEPLDRAALLLRAAAAGVAVTSPRSALPCPAVLSRPLLWRILSEAYLGETLFATIWGQPRCYVSGPARIDGARLRPDFSLPPRPKLVAHRTTSEVLYLLARDGLSARFEAVRAQSNALVPATLT